MWFFFGIPREVGGHDCGGLGPSGRCWWVTEEYVEPTRMVNEVECDD